MLPALTQPYEILLHLHHSRCPTQGGHLKLQIHLNCGAPLLRCSAAPLFQSKQFNFFPSVNLLIFHSWMCREFPCSPPRLLRLYFATVATELLNQGCYESIVILQHCLCRAELSWCCYLDAGNESKRRSKLKWKKREADWLSGTRGCRAVVELVEL